jgi:hypothetical protein
MLAVSYRQRLAKALTQPRLCTLLTMGAALVVAPGGQPAGGATAPTYYVSTTGSDANPGSLAQPWRTIGKAVGTVPPGATIYVRAGTYREHVTIELTGSASTATTLASYPDETATLSGAGIAVDEDEGLVFVLRSSFVTISGLRIEDSPRAGILVDRSDHIRIESCATRSTYSSGIGVWASQNVAIIGNEVVLACNGGPQECITVAGTNGFEVRGNHVHDSDSGDTAGGEGIDAKDGAANGVITGNHVHDIDRLGIYVDAWDKHTHDIIVDGNTVHDTEGDGITLASEMGGLLERIKVQNNLVWGNRLVGLTVANYGGVASHPMRDLLVINNTFVDNGIGAWGGGIAVDSPLATGVVVRNNIASQNLSFQIVVDSAVPADAVTIDHNLVDGFRFYENEIIGADSVTGNPLFRDPTRLDLHLLISSPAIDRGSPIGAPAVDLDRNPRPAGAAVDIGAYEHIPPSRSVVRRRLTGR